MNCRNVCFFGAVSLYFLFVYERICAKFTKKTCLVPRSGEFEGQGQRSKVKVTRDKNGIFSAISAACVQFMFGKTSLASSSKYIRSPSQGLPVLNNALKKQLKVKLRDGKSAYSADNMNMFNIT